MWIHSFMRYDDWAAQLQLHLLHCQARAFPANGRTDLHPKKLCIPRIFGPARAARQSAQMRSAPLHLASWEQLGSF